MGRRSMAIPKPGELSLGKAAEGVQIGSGHPASIQSVRRHQSPASLADTRPPMLLKEPAFLGALLTTAILIRARSWFKSTQAHQQSPVFMRAFPILPPVAFTLEKLFAKNLPKIRASPSGRTQEVPRPVVRKNSIRRFSMQCNIVTFRSPA
jgi:hypothetical protein